jgi:hypothetical protein
LASNDDDPSRLSLPLDMAPVAPKQNRKRKTVDPPAPTQPLETLTGDLVLESDAEEELLEDGLARGGAAGEEEDDDENEPFPELDLGSSDEEEDGDFEVGGNEADSEEDDPAAAGDDEEDLSDDDSEGYNSSDIDALSQSSTQPTSYTRSRTSRSKSPISNFIAENTTKPDERDPSIILRPEDPMAGKMVVSKLTGRPKRVYPDIEAGYGSESSTEDVSPSPSLSSAVATAGPSYTDPSANLYLGPESSRRHPRPLVRRPASHWIRRQRKEGHASRSG